MSVLPLSVAGYDRERSELPGSTVRTSTSGVCDIAAAIAARGSPEPPHEDNAAAAIVPHKASAE